MARSRRLAPTTKLTILVGLSILALMYHSSPTLFLVVAGLVVLML